MFAALAPPPSLTLACSRCLLSLTLGSVDGPLLYVHGFSSRCWPHRLPFSHPFVCLHIHISGAFAPMGNAITCTLSFLQLSIGSILQLPSLSSRLAGSAGSVPASSMVTVLRHPMPTPHAPSKLSSARPAARGPLFFFQSGVVAA
jgi:hypothetical protein